MTQNEVYLTPIKALYIETYSKGDSAQHFHEKNLESNLRTTLKKGKALLCFEQNSLIGVLLYAPLIIDIDCPEQILIHFDPLKCAYITEIMVHENYRGQGIGRKLIESFFETVDRILYMDVFIRVWNKNLTALALYERTGFCKHCEIKQTKTHIDGITQFEMEKIYLHKKLN